MEFPLTEAIASSVTYLDSVDSTNTAVKNDVDSLESFAVVASLNQTAGRGRRGREWLSVPGGTLAISVLVPFDSRRHPSTWLPIVAGVAAITSLARITNQEIDLKWPNDLLVGGKKVAGILCELVSTERAIVGVGANFSVPDQDLPPQGTSIWHPSLEKEHAIDAFVSALVHALREILDEMNRRDTAGELAKKLEPFLSTIGRAVRVWDTEATSWTGKAVGLSSRGHLIVELPSGERREVVAEDIEHLRE